MSHLNNKTLRSDDSVIEVTFKDGKGTLNFYSYDGSLNATFTFDYSYNGNTKQLVFSNGTSTSATYSLVTSKCEFDSYNQELVFRINNNTYGYYDNYKLSIHQ